MREIASIELHIIARELNDKINNSYVKKFYELGSDKFKFVLHREEKRLLYINLLKTINLTQISEQAEQATNFAMAIRKRIENGKITRIEQRRSDRILVLTIVSDKEYRMIIEMFGKGNLILTDKENKIELCYKIMDYKDRQIRPKAKYEFPKSESLVFENISKESLEPLLQEATKSNSGIISFLTKYLNIGPLYLEDIIKGAAINPKDVLKAKDSVKLSDAILDFFERLKKPNFIIYTDDKTVIDYSLVPLRKYEHLQKKEYGSMSELLDSLYIEQRLEVKDVEREGALKEITVSIEKQKELARSLSLKSDEYRTSANKIYEKMHEINSLIAYLRQNRRATIDELRQKFSSLNIKSIDLKNKTVKIDIE